MASTREAPNPLRPYYIPPSVGLPPDPLPAGHHSVAGRGGGSSYSATTTLPSRSTLSSSARGLFSDLDYSDYLSSGSPSATEVAKKLLDQALWKYTSVLLAHPFEVAKTVLQCHLVDAAENGRGVAVTRRPPADRASNLYDDDIPSDESEGDELAYFTSNRVPYSERERRRHVEDDRHATTTTPATPRQNHPSADNIPPHQLELRHPDSLLEVISQLWTKEGAWGVWKGANTTFVYSVLLKTIESWTRSLLAAVLNAPDPGLLPRVGVGVSSSVADSPQPWMSFGIAVAAAGIAGVVLAPLDIIRTRLILTPISSPHRSLPSAISHLQSYICPPSLLPITILHSIIPTMISSSTPILLRSRMGIDPVLSPTPYSILTFVSATVELFIRLPLETVLRRGQAHVALSSNPSPPAHHHRSAHRNINEMNRTRKPSWQENTIVPIGPYKGISGTIWSIIREEGGQDQGLTPTSSSSGDVRGTEKNTTTPGKRQPRSGENPGNGNGSGSGNRSNDTQRRKTKGQGIEGLCRGWRVGMWGLVGMWGANAFGGGGGIGGNGGISEF